jgi:hypothetical protein
MLEQRHVGLRGEASHRLRRIAARMDGALCRHPEGLAIRARIPEAQLEARRADLDP